MNMTDDEKRDAYMDLVYNLYRSCPRCGHQGTMGVTGVCGMCTMDEIIEERLDAEDKGDTSPKCSPPAV